MQAILLRVLGIILLRKTKLYLKLLLAKKIDSQAYLSICAKTAECAGFWGKPAPTTPSTIRNPSRLYARPSRVMVLTVCGGCVTLFRVA